MLVVWAARERLVVPASGVTGAGKDVWLAVDTINIGPVIRVIGTACHWLCFCCLTICDGENLQKVSRAERICCKSVSMISRRK